MKHFIFFTRLVAALLLIVSVRQQSAAQVSCTGDTPFFQVDLSASPNATWLSPAVVRDGSCCGGGANQVNCLEVELLLHPNAQGIIFEVASGANPGGSLFYQVNCQGVPLSSPNNTICLDGPGPHHISYCKVGNNQNTYTITSIPAATASEDITSSPSCPDTLSITGIDPTTVTWNSISPGNSGDYNGFLSNLDGTAQGANGVPFSGYADVIMTPVNGAPSQIMYEVCATPLGGCGEGAFCDTITVGVFNDLTLQINPQNPAICFGDNGADLTANVTGGIPPLSFNWSTGESTQMINVQNAGTYWVDVTDGIGCIVLSDTVVVNEITADIVSNAGADVTVCAEPIPTILLQGLVSGTNSGQWLNGQGNYNPNNQVLETLYTPTPAEVNAGFVDLTLSSTNNLGCPGDSDVIRINLPTFNTMLDTVISNVSCAGANDGSIDLEVTGGYAIDSYFWNTGATTQDISGLTSGTYQVQVVDEHDCAQNFSFVITEPNPLNIINVQLSNYPSGDNISCFGASDGSISLDVEGGISPYSYQWSNGMTSEDISSVGGGSYILTVTDANGCTIDTTIQLTEPSPIIQTITALEYPSGDNISCFGLSDGNIDYTISGGSPVYNILWNTGQSTEDISGIPAGTYSVNVTDINGCSADTSITLSQPTQLTQDIQSPTYFSGDHVSCHGLSDGSIDYTVNGGSPAYSITWNNGTNTEDLTGVSAGVYSVSVTDINGCSIDTTITLTEPAPLTQDLDPSVYAGGFNISCFGSSDGSIDYSVQGGAPGYFFSWNTGADSEDLASLEAGTYSVTVTDMNGCTTDTSIVLTEPPLLQVNASVTSDYNGQDISCYNASDASVDAQVNGGVPNYNMVWTNSLGDTVGYGSSLNNLPPGNYDIHVEDASGCTTYDAVTITQPDSLSVDIDILSNFNGLPVSCENVNDGSVQANVVGGTPAYSYSWSNGSLSANPIQNNLGSGTYYVTVTDLNNCSAVDTVILEAHPVPSVQVGAGDEACEGETVSFSVNSDIGTTATWSFENGFVFNGTTNSNVFFDDIGCFDVTLTVTSDQGCSETQVIENHICINPLPYADFSQSQAEVTTFSPIVQFWNQSNGAISVEWEFGDGSTSYDQNPYNTFPDDSSGTYQIQLIATSQYGCKDTVTSLVVVKEKLLIYVPNTFTPDNDDYNQVFLPILTQGFDPYNYELLIFNRWGEILFESHDHRVGWSGKYGGEIVKDGTYIWKINVKDKDGIMQQFKGHINLIR
ncbi:MAG: gliding motility-associated C-terminal domain-containing protein [Brumimicrobium sp.]|nr:gliding motility-associated C-terminal domain-containing protein [Brumimicrobium sp.]